MSSLRERSGASGLTTSGQRRGVERQPPSEQLPAGRKGGAKGEGGVLEALADDETVQDAELVAVLLAWEPRIDVSALAAACGVTTARVRSALMRLATSGRVGYDTAEAAYFHRQLPHDSGLAERHNPRLRYARALLSAGAVTLDGAMGTVTAEDGHTHRVREDAGVLRCSCLWWARYRGGRGPCKHALAVRMARRERNS
ncbi:SWIM zinc finger family protein [Streptomyces sp. BRB081]|nr:SWIM zinc finger family protein [Streptomyces sp. BRB081]